jgi:hypothetical protein
VKKLMTLACTLTALSLVGCDDSLDFQPILGPPAQSDATNLPLGTATYFSVSDVHPEVEGDTVFVMTSITSDDARIVRIVPDGENYIFLAVGAGTTTLHLVSNDRWDLPVAVFEQP